MLLRMIELGMPIDEIRFLDTGWEYPQTYKHIKKLEQYIGKEIIIVKPIISFDELFQRHGFPHVKCRWCTHMKRDSLNRGIGKEDYSYIGYTYDELPRIKKKVKKRGIEIYPLIEWGWTEEDCLQYCYSKGFTWDGLYTIFKRVSCWCCPFQSKRSLYALYKHFPELWEKLKEMQRQAPNSFRPNQTVFDLEKEFQLKDRQYKLFNNLKTHQKFHLVKSLDAQLSNLN